MHRRPRKKEPPFFHGESRLKRGEKRRSLRQKANTKNRKVRIFRHNLHNSRTSSNLMFIYLAYEKLAVLPSAVLLPALAASVFRLLYLVSSEYRQLAYCTLLFDFFVLLKLSFQDLFQ